MPAQIGILGRSGRWSDRGQRAGADSRIPRQSAVLGPVYMVLASRVACENRPVAGEARKAYREIRLSASTNQRAIFAATRKDAPLLADCRVARRLWTSSPRRSSLLALVQNRQRRGRDDHVNRAWPPFLDLAHWLQRV